MNPGTATERLRCVLPRYAAAKSVTPTHVIPSRGRGSVSAVASLGDQVFVARFSCPSVSVYDAGSFKLRRRLILPGLNWPISLAACNENNCLYASGYLQYCVYRADLSCRGAVTKWSVASGPAGLSVNSKHNLIVACYDASVLQEYTTNGSLVREIRLHAGVTRPFHAVQLSTGDYAVSQYTSSGVVSVVGAHGQVLRRYGQSQTSPVEQLMKYPSSLAVTRNDDILVAGRDNNKILSINSSRGSVKELVLSVDGGIHGPRGLCLDESRGRLYVAEFDGDCRLLVFDGVQL